MIDHELDIVFLYFSPFITRSSLQDIVIQPIKVG
jgi:hypothetical protein